MEIKILQPDQIIIPGEYELGNQSILKIYYRIFDNGHGGDLPPVIVTKPSHFNYFKLLDLELQKRFKSFDNWKKINPVVTDIQVQLAKDKTKEFNLSNKKRYYGLIKKINEYSMKHDDIYLLIDGNHRSVAATLTNNPIQALELQINSDLKKINRMLEEGDLFNFETPDKSLNNLVNLYYDSCCDRLDMIKTVKERVDKLTSERDLPQYMIKKYNTKFSNCK